MAEECFFRLHVIPPPRPLGWESPKALLFDALLHHILMDPAPIGHFHVEIKSQRPNAYGVNHVVTGMSRVDRLWTTWKVARDQVGLGTFFYDFPGALDEGLRAQRGLSGYRKRKRLKTLHVPLTTDRAELLFDELHQWILQGAYRHYGGGHHTLRGEGAGCADFGAHFLRLALGCSSIPREWVREVYGPFPLIGNVEEGRKVSLLRVFREGARWAEGPEQGRLYSTPDMELAWAWMESRAPGADFWTLRPEQVDWCEGPAPRIDFRAGYAVSDESELRQVWERIKVFF